MAARVLVLCETAWDRRQLEASREHWQGRFEPEFLPPSDVELPWDFDVGAFLERIGRERGPGADPGRRVQGVFSSSDYPGATLAGALSQVLGTPGCAPERLLRSAHKYYSRLAQRECVPEAVPAFDLIDPTGPRSPAGPGHGAAAPRTGFPCFVKPVKGSFSQLARRIDGPEELEQFLGSPAVRAFLSSWMEVFDGLVRLFTDFEHGGKRFVAEGLLEGSQTTVEGYCRGTEVRLLGVVDSSFHAGTRSFSSFDYPSALPAPVQERMRALVERLVRHLGLTDTCFNVELIWEPGTERLSILEINPRLAGQFADLYQKVDGVNAYEIALALCTGAALPSARSGSHACAASIPLRLFRPTRVLRAPTADDVRAAEALFPGTNVWLECRSGQVFDDFLEEDGASVRYGVVNLGADSRAELVRRAATVIERLGFRLEPL